MDFRFSRIKAALVAVVISALLLPQLTTASPMAQSATNLAKNKPATASSIEAAGFEAAKAVDGSATSRWASAEGVDPQWVRVDLGATATINRVVLKWEAAYGKSYRVEVSANGSTWTPIFTTTTGNGATDDLAVSGSGRYVRVYGTARGTAYGYSLFELEVYGGGTNPTPPTSTPVTPTATPPPSGAPTASQLLAKLNSCNQISSGLYRTDSETSRTIAVCQLSGAVFWKADMDIDCDGKRTAVCNEQTDPWFLPETAATDSHGDPLDASTLPYVVIPSTSSTWKYSNYNIQLGAIVAVIYNGKVEYGVFGDTGPVEIIGEASYAMAQRLGIDPNPATGGTDSGVSYIVFQGSNVSPIEDRNKTVTKGQQLAQQFLNNN